MEPESAPGMRYLQHDLAVYEQPNEILRLWQSGSYYILVLPYK